jgi:hypothetical protein
MLTKLELLFFSGLLTLLLSSDLFVLRLLELLLVLVVDGSLALKSKTAALLSNTRRNRPKTVAKDVLSLLLSSLELFLDVTLGRRGWLTICLEAFLNLWFINWRGVTTLNIG